MRRGLLFAGLVIVGLAEAWWAKTYFAESVYYSALLAFAAAGAWSAAPGGRLAGILVLAFVHALIVVSWLLDGAAGADLVVAAGIAAGFALVAWASAKGRPHVAAAGYALAGLVQTWWTVGNANLAFEGYFLGNVLFTLGAGLAAAGAWRPPGRAASPS